MDEKVFLSECQHVVLGKVQYVPPYQFPQYVAPLEPEQWQPMLGVNTERQAELSA